MTDKLRAAAEMALEALNSYEEKSWSVSINGDLVEQAQAALRQALKRQTWVHLLTDEKADIRNSVDYSQFMSAEEYAIKVQDATEAKLKELNYD